MKRWVRNFVTRIRRVILTPLVGVGLRMVRRRATPFAMRVLYFAWSNSWAAEPEYLMAVALRIETQRPLRVLECGSGLTTLVLGELARKHDFTVVTLEADEQWAARTRSQLQRFDLDAVRVVHAPIKEYEACSWYSLPSDLPDHFDLVVCDGPHGVRYGLLPVLGDRLTGATVLADDANTSGVLQNTVRWRDEFGAHVVIDAEVKRGLAVVTLPGQRSGTAST